MGKQVSFDFVREPTGIQTQNSESKTFEFVPRYNRNLAWQHQAYLFYTASFKQPLARHYKYEDQKQLN